MQWTAGFRFSPIPGALAPPPLTRIVSRGIMRTICIIVALLGLLLLGHSLLRIRAIRQFRSEVHYVQAQFLDFIRVSRDPRAVYTGFDPKILVAPLDAVDTLEDGWWLVTGMSAGVVSCGVGGIYLARRRRVSANGD